MKRHKVTDPDIVGAEKALIRAAERARRIAAITGTPLVIWRNGHVSEEKVDIKTLDQPKDPG